MRYLIALLLACLPCFAQTSTPVSFSQSTTAAVNGQQSTVTVNLSGTIVVTPIPGVVTPGPGYQLTTPAQDVNGWTVIPTLNTGRAYYVSYSTGNDANNGLTSSTPVKSLSAAMALLRTGYGDHLLLKAGDTWPSGQAFGSVAGLSGASRTDPIVITSYGTGNRPVVQSANTSAIAHTGTNPTAHLWVVGIDFYSDAGDPLSATYSTSDHTGAIAVNTIGPVSDVLFEDCRFRFYCIGLDIALDDGNPGLPVTDIKVRRCEILDSYCVSGSHSQGIYIYGATNVLLDGNILDHNGWYQAPASGATGAQNTLAANATATQFNHNAYTLNDTNVSFINNVTCNASNYGFTASETGGSGHAYTNLLVQNNLFLGNGNDLVLGADTPAANVSSTIKGNIFEQTGSGGVAQGTGITVGSASGLTISNNWFIDKAAISNYWLDLQSNAQATVGVTANHVAGWLGEDGTGAGLVNQATSQAAVTLAPNTLRSTNWTRTAAGYDTLIGGPGTLANLDGLIRTQSHATWQPSLAAPAMVTWIGGGQ